MTTCICTLGLYRFGLLFYDSFFKELTETLGYSYNTEQLKKKTAALKKKPDYADARYLLGRLLLAKGQAGDAVEIDV